MPEYEVGDRLYWYEIVVANGDDDLPDDAPERYATVDDIDADGTVYLTFDDGLADWMHENNVPDYMERVTWDHKTS